MTDDIRPGVPSTQTPLGRVLTEVCRHVPWNPQAQRDLVSAVATALPDLFPAGVLMIPGEQVGTFADGNHLRVYVEGDTVVAPARDLSDVDQLLNDLLDPDPCQLDHDGDCQAHGWFNDERPCPMRRVRELFGWPLTGRVEDEEIIEEPDTEQLTGIHNTMAKQWLEQGTLDLPALAASIGMNVDQGVPADVLRARPLGPVQSTFGYGISMDTREMDVPSGVRTQLSPGGNSFPAVEVVHHAGHNLRMCVEHTRSELDGSTKVAVIAYQDSGTARPPIEVDPHISYSADEMDATHREIDRLNALVSQHENCSAHELEALNAELRVEVERLEGQLKACSVQLDSRNSAYLALTRDHAVLKGDLDKASRTLRLVGERVHVEANRLNDLAVSMLAVGSPIFHGICDIMVNLRQQAINECGAPYAETDRVSTNDLIAQYNELTPWPVRQWALLARQTLEQEADRLRDERQVIGHEAGTRLFKMAETLASVVAEYPEDLDAVQAEQATRNADAEAVRRLAHAMTEVANQLEARWSTMRMFVADGDAFVIPYAVDKLRCTVDGWTSEEQRRPWAEAKTTERPSWPGEMTLSSEGTDDTTERTMPPRYMQKILDAVGTLPEVWVQNNTQLDVDVTIERQQMGQTAVVAFNINRASSPQPPSGIKVIQDGQVIGYARDLRVTPLGLDASVQLDRDVHASAASEPTQPDEDLCGRRWAVKDRTCPVHANGLGVVEHKCRLGHGHLSSWCTCACGISGEDANNQRPGGLWKGDSVEQGLAEAETAAEARGADSPAGRMPRLPEHLLLALRGLAQALDTVVGIEDAEHERLVGYRPYLRWVIGQGQ